MFDVQLADDLVQTALERALAHWHQFDQRRDILVWTVSIAHNAYMDDRRRHARTPWFDADPEAALAQAQAATSDPGLRIDLLAALKRLPAEQREPILLVAVEQLSYAECAEVLRIPVGTVMSRISRGRVALRALLEGRPAPAAHGLRRVV